MSRGVFRQVLSSDQGTGPGHWIEPPVSNPETWMTNYFSLKENLNKRFADRRASVRDADIDSRIKEEIQTVFPGTEGIDRKFFPEQGAQIPDVPSITFVIMSAENSIQDDAEIQARIESLDLPQRPILGAAG